MCVSYANIWRQAEAELSISDTWKCAAVFHSSPSFEALSKSVDNEDDFYCCCLFCYITRFKLIQYSRFRWWIIKGSFSGSCSTHSLRLPYVLNILVVLPILALLLLEGALFLFFHGCECDNRFRRGHEQIYFNVFWYLGLALVLGRIFVSYSWGCGLLSNSALHKVVRHLKKSELEKHFYLLPKGSEKSALLWELCIITVSNVNCLSSYIEIFDCKFNFYLPKN